MCPIAQTEGHDGPGLSLQPVPSVTAMVEKRVDLVEAAVGQPVPAPGQAAGDLVLLADPRLVAKPDFHVGDIDAVLARDACQQRGELYGWPAPSIGRRLRLGAEEGEDGWPKCRLPCLGSTWARTAA